MKEKLKAAAIAAKSYAKKLGALIWAEASDPAVQRGALVAVAWLFVKYGLDQEHADQLAGGVGSALMLLMSRMPGKGQS